MLHFYQKPCIKMHGILCPERAKILGILIDHFIKNPGNFRQEIPRAQKAGRLNDIFVIIYIYIYITSSSRTSRGRKFQKKKNYIAKKEFAYRMCARRPTSAMPKPFLCCERAFCCSMVVMWPVLMQRDVMWCAPMWFDAMCLLVLCHVT